MSNPSRQHRASGFFLRNRYVIAAFFISAAIITFGYVIKQVYPFGDRTVLKVDLYHQYAPYIEELRSRILKGQSLLFSWEGGLGKDFVAQMAYYTTSPFNLLIFLFPKKHLPEMVALTILLKISLASSVFTWYLQSRFGRKDLSVLTFGLMYGFCAFLTSYYWNIMWLDTVVLFPLVARGVELPEHPAKLISTDTEIEAARQGQAPPGRSVTKKSSWGSGESFLLYYVALTLTMIVNFYLAVLVCVLITLYFLALTFTAYPPRAEKGNITIILRRCISFSLVSVLCALTAIFILAPVGIALSATAVSDSTFPSFDVYPNVWQLAVNHFLGARPCVLARNEDLPNIYSGVLTLVLLPLYYGNSGIRRREKLFLGLILLFMLACSCIKPLDYLIHGLHFPANLPHRFTFVYSFILLGMGYQAYLHLDTVRYRWAVLTGVLYAFILLASEYFLVPCFEELDRVLSDKEVFFNLLLVLLYLILLSLKKRGRLSRLAGGLMFALVCLECSYTDTAGIESTCSRSDYIRYMDDAAEAVDYLNEKEDGRFFRTEFRRFTTINDASLYHYNGFSQFSSLEPGGISQLMQNLGLAATSNSFRYYDPTPLIDAIFNMKYVLNKDAEHPKKARYSFDRQFGTVWVYHNPRCLPLGFLTDSSILDWNTRGSQPFAVQNDFVRKATGLSDDMFTLIEPDFVTTDHIAISSQERKGSFVYQVENPADLSRLPSVQAEFTSDQDQYLYLYVDAGNAQRFAYKDDSSHEDRELSAGRSLIDVGHVKAGEKIYVSFNLTKRGAFEKKYRESGTVSLYAASYHDDVFQKAYEILSDRSFTITDHSDTMVTGRTKADTETVLFTSIPLTKGWEVYVDGERSRVTPLGDGGLVGVRLFSGEHEVSFRYHQRVLVPAVLISLAGLVLYCLYYRSCNRIKPE